MTILDENQVYQLWVKAWHEDVSILDKITAPACMIHQARTDGKSTADKKGAEALKGIIKDACAFFDDVDMTVVVGPIIDSPYVSARWQFAGAYKGGMPGAKAEVGKIISFNGMDIMQVEDGKIKGYWVSSDGVHLMEQLGVF
ncbi:ester cyclase [Gracilibacillus lacisalsi]|uniref:ester cyclase n=1 Tax=Gracilibacillus lacisalsi TaxID=393087 RepID=UPI0003723717|nr:ester cyclase [Gracilibacillus lacisalsi]